MKRCIFLLSLLVCVLFVKASNASNAYTITFDTNGGTEVFTQTVLEGQCATMVYTSKEGFEFTFWAYNDMPFDFSTPIYQDYTLVAIYDKKIYEVSFDYGYKIENVYYEYGDIINKPVDPIKEGYSFIGWYMDEELYDFNTNIKSDVDLKAKYSFNYNIRLIASYNSYNANVEITDDLKLVKPIDPYIEGYNFIGWFTEFGYLYDFDTKITSDLTLIAGYDPIKYKVTLVIDDLVLSVNVKYNEKLSSTYIPKKNGYDFIGWYTIDGTPFDSEIVNDITLYAKYGEETDSFAKVLFYVTVMFLLTTIGLTTYIVIKNSKE